MSEHPTNEIGVSIQECELNDRKDMQCDCFAEHAPLWGPACKGKFVPVADDFGDVWCADCGHSGACHE